MKSFTQREDVVIYSEDVVLQSKDLVIHIHRIHSHDQEFSFRQLYWKLNTKNRV